MMMKSTEQILIKYLFYTLIFAQFFGCSSSVKDQSIEHNKKKRTTTKLPIRKAPKKKTVALTNENLEAELLKYGEANKETLVLMKTPKGTMKIKLYENTPLHRANFIRLVKNNFYKETMFYRVVNDFMIQGGDNDDWSRQTIKSKMGTYTIPPEFRKENIHKKGAMSMAREYENNPEKRSVSFEWFIVQGTLYTEGEILGAEQVYNLSIPEEHRNIYKTQGGTPHLDGQHTVFGQVVEGLSVIDSIAAVKVDDGDWPIQNITIEFQILE
ncbi:MAG: peptidylprolyl isomerase [Salinivirgaceae bacterium]|jgi:peptidyl-prolyl cis-trans isomerase A (cyclophilin A)|nr:peptidylprolyl isomerase [Salinivirgaceae bacterium]